MQGKVAAATTSSIKQRRKICPECGGDRLMNDYDQGELVCMDCGFVIDDKITDTGPEWRAFDDEQRAKRARVGAPLTYTIHDKGLSTLIDWHNQDTCGKGLNPVQMSQVFMLRKWHRRIRVADASEKNLAFALSEMNKIATALNLPKSILETAAVLYRRAVKKRLIRGRSIQGIAAAAIYMSCRKCAIPRTLDELTRVICVSKKEICRCYRFLARELEEFIPPALPLKYASKFSNQLFVSGKATMVAASILESASNLRITSGRGPTGIAAAATYIASVLAGDRKTQREIAEIANVTEVTIRNRYRELMDKLDIKVRI
ncbi:MAG: transcription initiation factor IIB [Candidatus Bathyarchaeia archaeon]